LIPGYKQVEKFGADEEYEDEEVSYVTLDLGSVEPTLLPSSSTYRLIVSLQAMPFTKGANLSTLLPLGA
jgi:general transcription factor 3C polypeptide 6